MDERAREVFAEAYETLERTADVKVRPSANEAWLARKPDPVTQPAQFNRWLASQPEQQEVVPPQRSMTSAAPESTPPAPTLTDSQTLRWQNYIDGRIDAGIAAALKARAWHDEAKTEAIGTALGTIRAQLRDEIAAAVGELRADFEIAQKAAERREQDRGEIIDMPNPLMRSRRAG